LILRNTITLWNFYKFILRVRTTKIWTSLSDNEYNHDYRLCLLSWYVCEIYVIFKCLFFSFYIQFHNSFNLSTWTSFNLKLIPW